MKTFLMCKPLYYRVAYDINPWMTNNINRVNRPLAYKQWHELYSLIKHSANIKLIDPHPDYPDMVFTANAGTVFPGAKTVIISQFAAPERRGETPLFKEWFGEHGWGALTFDCYQYGGLDSCFEGDGDLLFDPEGFYWIGHGWRTQARSVEILQRYLNAVTVVPLRLIDERFYHLDTCFCPLSGGWLMYYPGAFDQKSQDRIREIKGDKLIAVDEEDAQHFACNAVEVYDGFVVMPLCSRALWVQLLRAGFTAQMVNLSEFIKSGGAAKCLTLVIDGRAKHKVGNAIRYDI